MANKEPKILLFDIETAPNLGYVWGKWEQDVVSFKEHWYMLSFAYKWLGEKQTHVVSLPDFKLYKKDKANDRELVNKLWELFNEADVLIAHNGDEFDVKKVNSRFIQHGMVPPKPFQTIDTKKVAKRYFKFDSNNLDDLGQYLGLGRKLQTGGFDLWLGCISGDKESWKRMCNYNKQDVVLLEQVYLKLRPWMTNHPNMNLLTGEAHTCPNCGCLKVSKQGFKRSRTGIRQQYKCGDCGAWSSGESVKLDALVLR